MWRKVLIGIIVLVVIFIGFTILKSSTQPRVTSWKEFYSPYSNEPFGTRIFVNQLKNFFPNEKVARFDSEEFNKYYFSDSSLDSLSIDSLLNLEPDTSTVNGLFYSDSYNLIAFGTNLYGSEYACNRLIDDAFHGSHIQLYAYNIPYILSNRLELYFQWYYANGIDTLSTKEQVFAFNDSFAIRTENVSRYIYNVPEKAEVLLKTSNDSIQGVKFNLGYGSISIIRRPSILSNNDLLYYDHKLVEELIKDLPQQSTYWATNINIQEKEEKTLLRLIYSYPTLKWAYFILLFSVIAYLLLNLQRRQQIVPIVEPPKNLSLAYLKTISDLYLSRQNYKTVLQRKMKFTLAEIKSTYRLQANKVDAEYIEQLATRSNLDIEELTDFFNSYNKVIEEDIVTKDEFKMMCKKFQLLKNK